MLNADPLEDQLRQCFGLVVYTHKTHLKMADGCARKLAHLKFWQIVISGLSSCGVFSAVFTGSKLAKVAAVLLSLTTFWIAGLMKNFDPGASAQKHRDAAASLWDIRESYLSLLTDLRSGAASAEQAMERRNGLQAKLAALYKGAPQTNAKAYNEAQEALKNNEEYTFSDSEINAFLPKSLRKGEGD